MRHRPTTSGLTRTPFPPIADYGFLSDCETTALLAPDGSVEWLCLPRMDSPSVFGSILDRDAGSFRLGPTGVGVPAGRRYLPGTMVLETSWGTRGGWMVVRDALLIGPWHHANDRSHTHRRTPTDYDADHVLLRTVRCVNGEVQLGLACEPAFDYGTERANWEYGEDGYHVAIARAPGSDIELRMTTDLNLGIEGPRRHRAPPDQGGRDVLLRAVVERAPRAAHLRRGLRAARLDRAPLAALARPRRVPRPPVARRPPALRPHAQGPHVRADRRDRRRGDDLAARDPGGERNWDYRYSWIRDSTFALWGLYTLGFDWEANDFFYFVADMAKAADGGLQIMYGIDGRAELPERTLDHLSGYEGARPVRVGNDAHSQAQHDVWGAVLDSVYLHTKSRDSLPDSVWPMLVHQVETAIENWRGTDRGIWEVRGEPQHFTSSKLMCWVALDRGARLAELREDWERATAWRAVADEIHADICEHALDARGVFTQHYDTEALDASVLLMPLTRFLPADDPRIRATVLAIADELTDDGLVLRYRVEATDDGLQGEEGAFTICSFWLVSALCEIGEIEAGRDLCEKLLGYSSPLGLYAEEIDTRSGRHLGNFPQAFTHLALINAVMHVIHAEEEIETRFSTFTRDPALAAEQDAPPADLPAD